MGLLERVQPPVQQTQQKNNNWSMTNKSMTVRGCGCEMYTFTALIKP